MIDKNQHGEERDLFIYIYIYIYIYKQGLDWDKRTKPYLRGDWGRKQ